KLSSLTVNRRYKTEEAGKYRAWLEKQYGRAKLDGNRMYWLDDPNRNVVAVFQGEEGGYPLPPTPNSPYVGADMKPATKPGPHPFEPPRHTETENIEVRH